MSKTVPILVDVDCDSQPAQVRINKLDPDSWIDVEDYEARIEDLKKLIGSERPFMLLVESTDPDGAIVGVVEMCTCAPGRFSILAGSEQIRRVLELLCSGKQIELQHPR